MDYVETEGNSIDEAIEKALQALGAERSKVEIEILANSSRGLFGIGGKKARVRASLRRPLEHSGAPGEEPRQEAQRRHERPASRDPAEPRAPLAAPPRRPPRATRAATEEPPEPVPLEVVENGRRVLEDLIQRMGFAAAVEARPDAGRVLLEIRGEEASVLIGRRGQTLDALEYLTNRLVTRDDDSAGRLAVDCEQYREKRRQLLEDLARRAADRAKRRGRPVTLNPMSPRDRRIVHLTLQDDPQLTTRSSGNGYFRKLLIIPEGERRARGRTSRE